MKYIVTEHEDFGKEIFIFPKTVNHDVMMENISHMRNRTHGSWKRIDRTPVSAGFVVDGRCTGKSESLHLASKPEDTELLLGLGKIN